MSHHYSGPDVSFPHGDARLDLTDLYAFPKPGSAGKSILIMNVIRPPASIRRDRPVRIPSRPTRRTRSRLTRTATMLPNCVQHASLHSQAGRRPQGCAASGPGTMERGQYQKIARVSSLERHACQTEKRNRRLPIW